MIVNMTVNNDRIDLLLIQQKLHFRRSGMVELCYRVSN